MNMIKVRFFMRAIVNAYASIDMLVKEYVSDEKYDVKVIFPSKNEFFYKNYCESLRQTRRDIENFVSCLDFDDYDLQEDDPELCFFLSETNLDSLEPYRNGKRLLVMLQHRPILIHSSLPARNEAIYGNSGSKFVDYFVCNDFMTNWLNERYSYPEKILNVGYPKMDSMYYAVKDSEKIVPDLWREKLKGKKVFLYNWMTILGKRLEEELCFNTYEKYLNDLMNHFIENDKEALIIRTRENLEIQVPDYIWDSDIREKFRKICNDSSSIILDESDTYYPAFCVSDALISSYSSLITYFFSMGKPVLFLNGNQEEYKCECKEWMKYCWVADCKEDISTYLNDVTVGRIKELKTESFTKGFDGQGCKRIKKTLEEKLGERGK